MKFAEHISVYVKTTDTCQLNCRHCFTGGDKNQKNFFSPIQVSSFLKRLAALHPEIKSVSLSFHGGEPMLAPTQLLEKFRSLTKELFPTVEYRMQTNLVYPLTAEKEDFIKSLPSVGTSWDYDLRFNTETFSTWKRNVKRLTSQGVDLCMIVSLSAETIKKRSASEIIKMAINQGFGSILFERISPTGNALINTEVIPKNEQLNLWFFEMYKDSIEERLYEKIDNLFLSGIMSSFVAKQHRGCRTRSCEKNVITINADGTIGGCPDSAPYKPYGHIDESIEEIFSSKKRLENIACEMYRNKECYTCPVFDICNGDCYQLRWDENCPAPKSLMALMKKENNTELYKKFII